MGIFISIFSLLIPDFDRRMRKKSGPIVRDNNFCYPPGFLRCLTGDALKSLPFPPKGLIRA